MVATFGLVKKIAAERQIVVLIVKDYFNVIQNCLMYQGTTIKLETLRLLVYLCNDKEITTFMVVQKHLQQIITELIKQVRDTDTLLQLVILTRVILGETNKKCGMTALAAIEDHLCHKVGIVGQQASALVDELAEDL